MLDVDLFVEDHGQQQLLRAIIDRVAAELQCRLSIQERSAIGGHPRLARELGIYQRAIEQGGIRNPDVLVIGWDANCKGKAAYDEVVSLLREPLKSNAVIACPEPHIERWYMIDQVAFEKVVGPAPAIKQPKCEKSIYKSMLAQAAVDAGQVVALGGIEFAREIVAETDWYRAGKFDSSFKRFIDDLRGALKRCSR